MNHYISNKPIYHTPQPIAAPPVAVIGNYPNKPEQIYCDPEVVKKNVANSEKDAIRYITEKYDTIRLLDDDRALDTLDLSPGDSVTKLPLEDEDTEEDSAELTELDISQVEVFFRSHKTYVSVCRCLANLYFCASDSNGDWGEPARTGVPVLLLDKGETKARNKRMLQIVLAEKGTGFVLWKDVIDNLSNYQAAEQGGTFHTMFLSSDHRRMAGLSFDAPDSADAFLREVEQLTADPLNISLSVPKNKKKKPKAPKKEKVKPPKKCDISTPCCFQHVTSVALDDKKKLFSMATLVAHDRRPSS